MNLNQHAKIIHAANAKWWQDLETGKPIPRNAGELLALVISEICECLEGERKNLMDDHLPHRKMAEVEMADAYIRLLDFAGGFEIKIFEGDEPWQIPDNKGEALFELISCITRIDGFFDSYWIGMSLACIKSYCEKHGYDLNGAIEEKLSYNAKREDHKPENRKRKGGKKF